MAEIEKQPGIFLNQRFRKSAFIVRDNSLPAALFSETTALFFRKGGGPDRMPCASRKHRRASSLISFLQKEFSGFNEELPFFSAFGCIFKFASKKIPEKLVITKYLPVTLAVGQLNKEILLT